MKLEAAQVSSKLATVQSVLVQISLEIQTQHVDRQKK